MKHILLLAAAPALMLAGCNTMDRPEGSEAGVEMAAVGGQDMTPTERGGYVQLAAASDKFEIESSQLALQKARRPEVRELANMLVADHSRTTQQLMTTARSLNVQMTEPRLTTFQAGLMRNLQRSTADEFDATYLRGQVPAHEAALMLHRNYAENGDDPQLKALAAAAVPVIQMHLDRARQLSQ